jgi:hypothetical protein
MSSKQDSDLEFLYGFFVGIACCLVSMAAGLLALT